MFDALCKENVSAYVPAAAMEEQICSKRKQHVDKWVTWLLSGNKTPAGIRATHKPALADDYATVPRPLVANPEQPGCEARTIVLAHRDID